MGQVDEVVLVVLRVAMSCWSGFGFGVVVVCVRVARGFWFGERDCG